MAPGEAASFGRLGEEEESADWAVKREGAFNRLAQRLVCCAVNRWVRRSGHLPLTLRCKSSSLHLTAIVLKLPGRALLGKAQVGGASCPVHAHSSPEESPSLGFSFLGAAGGPERRWFRCAGCKETVPAARERAGPFRERGCALPGAMLLLGILMLLPAGAPAGGSEPEREVVVPSD